MTSYIVGCDNILGGESGIIHKVAKVLEKNGNKTEELSVGPNFVQSAGKKSSSKGKVAVFIVGGSDVGTYVDFRIGLRNGGYYHYKYIWFAFASWTATTDKWITENGLKKTGLVRAHDDNFSRQSDIAPWLGKSADYFFKQNKAKMGYVYGQSPEELAEKILGGNISSSNSSASESSTTIKDAMKEVLSAWDGDVECFVRDDTVHIRKIPDPSKAKLSIVESENVIYDSISVTDVNPSTVNCLKVNYANSIITIEDKSLQKRFGKIESTVSPTGLKSVKEAESFARTEWNKLRRDNGHVLELKVPGDVKWKAGEWCSVYLPSFDINDYMYISKMSQDDSTEWICNLTLVDYPPSLGKPEDYANNDNSNKDSEDEDDSEEDTS